MALSQNVTVDANGLSRIFHITATTGDFTLAGLKLTGGRTTGFNSFFDTLFSGGAIRSLTSGNLTLDQSTVSGNSTEGSRANGGGISSSGSLTLISSTVSGNSTEGDSFADGGGISSSGDVTLTSSTVSGNSTASFSGRGGGIFSFGAVTLTSSTVSDNHATHSSATGGGIWNSVDAITITNSIVAGNGAGGGSPDINPGTGTFSANFSLLGTAVTPDAGSSENKFSDSPLLGPLADNGGPTETHALLAGSLAIGKGDPSILFNPAEFDQRGAPFVRVFGGRIDIGAVEDQPIPASADFDTDGDVDGADFLAWQRGFGTPGADKTDGDADNDNDVDGVDLGIWETNYGSGATLLAAVTSGPSPVASAALIDAAIALSLESSPIDEPLVTEAPNVEGMPIAVVVFDPTAAASVGVPASDNIFTDETTENDVTKQTNQPWLTDELLERVFG